MVVKENTYPETDSQMLPVTDMVAKTFEKANTIISIRNSCDKGIESTVINYGSNEKNSMFLFPLNIWEVFHIGAENQTRTYANVLSSVIRIEEMILDIDERRPVVWTIDNVGWDDIIQHILAGKHVYVSACWTFWKTNLYRITTMYGLMIQFST